jgi:hypothetical protein
MKDKKVGRTRSAHRDQKIFVGKSEIKKLLGDQSVIGRIELK